MVIRLVPKWLFVIYAKLWSKKRYSWFIFREAQKITGIKKLVRLSKAFSLLKSAGWIEVKKNRDNPRTRMYRLVQLDIILRNVSR